MALTTAGVTYMAQAAFGTNPTPFNGTNARIGVGDSTTVFSAAHTDLQAATNKFRKIVDSAPTGGSNVLTLVATFATGEANFAWQEWGVFNASSAGTMLNRKVESLGTKPGTQTWQFTVTLTFAAA
jgi:hypothetical protein